MGYLTNGLSFNTLREANIERLKASKYKKCETEWTPAHWMPLPNPPAKGERE